MIRNEDSLLHFCCVRHFHFVSFLSKYWLSLVQTPSSRLCFTLGCGAVCAGLTQTARVKERLVCFAAEPEHILHGRGRLNFPFFLRSMHYLIKINWGEGGSRHFKYRAITYILSWEAYRQCDNILIYCAALHQSLCGRCSCE